jgi:hypothetical protein
MRENEGGRREEVYRMRERERERRERGREREIQSFVRAFVRSFERPAFLGCQGRGGRA